MLYYIILYVSKLHSESWYQNDSHTFITLFAKNLREENVDVKLDTQSVWLIFVNVVDMLYILVDSIDYY